MSYPAKTKRNKELVKKKRQGWSYKELGEYFNLNKKTAWEIYQNELKRKSLGVTV
jgi:hypothetical protein